MNLSTTNPLNNGTHTIVPDILGNDTVLHSTTDLPYPHKGDEKNRSVLYLVVPLITIGIIAALTVMVILFLRKKRLDRLRHRLMPFYSFEPGEEEDWETELLDDDTDITNRKGYKSMDFLSSVGQKSQFRIE